MAVVQVNSAQITARNTGALANSYQAGASVQSAVAQVAVGNGDSIGSVYRLVRIPASARLVDLTYFGTAITSGAGDVGLYQIATYGGAVVDADFFTAASSVATASTGTRVGFGNLLSPANRDKRIWEALGLTADPQREYDIAITLTAATTAAGTFGVDAEFVQ